MALRRSDERRLIETIEQLEDARQARDDAIVEAYRHGASLGEIARAVDMTHQGISKLLHRLGVREPWKSVEDANREHAQRDLLQEEQ